MTITQLIIVLKARWRAVLTVFLLVVALIALATALLPRKYTATASVVLDVQSPDPIAGIVLPGMSASSYVATQVDVLRSERVALRAIRALGFDKDAEMRERWQEATEGVGEYESWLAETVLLRLEALPSRESNVINLSYTAKEPQLAAAMANAFVKAYVDTNLELRTEPAKEYNAFFDERAKQLRDQLEQAQNRLSDYQRKHGIIATDERLDVENARLAELSTQLVALEAVANESGSRQSAAGNNADRMSEVLSSPIITSLTADLSRQEARLNELNARLGDQHPQVQELRASISQLRSRIQSETKRITGSVSVNNSVNQARLSQLRAELQEQRTKVLRMKSQRDEASVLLRDVENATRAYEAVFNRVNQTTLESQNRQTNVSVLKQASMPVHPSSPRVVLNMAVAVVLGLMLGGAVALLREMFDKRLRTETDVIELLQQPLLTALPVRNALPGRSRMGLSSARVMSIVPRLAK